MARLSRRLFLLGSLAGLVACGRPPEVGRAAPPGVSPRMLALVDKWARAYGLPPALVHRVVQRESGYDPAARNGSHYGLMQIHPQTARSMGFRGAPSDLLDPETNLRWAVKYLRGAWLVSDGSEEAAIGWYSRGYYYEAKRRGMLRETGLG